MNARVIQWFSSSSQAESAEVIHLQSFGQDAVDVQFQPVEVLLDAPGYVIDPAGVVRLVFLGLDLAQLIADDELVVQGGVLGAVDDDGAEAGDQPASAEQEGRALKDYICLNGGVNDDRHQDEGDTSKCDRDLEQKRYEFVEGLVLLVGLLDKLPLYDLVSCIGLFLPFRTNPLKSFSVITPLRYFSLSLYWLVLKPQVLVRQGTTTNDQLVVGICLLLMRSLYLSGRGRNSSLISSLTSLELRNIQYRNYYKKEVQIEEEEKRTWKWAVWKGLYVYICYYSISMKKVKEEEEYFLSGWDDREENEEYGCHGLNRQMQQPMLQVVKQAERPKVPHRTHARYRTKEHCSSKFSDVTNLRKDKAFLQQYLRKETQNSAETHRTFLLEDSQQARLKHNNEILQTLHQRHHHYQSAQLQPGNLRTDELESRQEKEFLFSGVSQKKRDRRKYLLKVHHLEVSEKPTAEVNCLFRKKTLLPEKPAEQTKEEKQVDYRPYKKNLKFPLFYRQLNSTGLLAKEKPHTIALLERPQKKYSLLKHCSSTEFTDDSIFSSKFIRA